MIFPKDLPYVTLYLPTRNEYFQLSVSGAQTTFTSELFYSREAISAKKDVKISGLRIDMSLSFEQTLQHETIRRFWNGLYAESSQTVYLYFEQESDIDSNTDYIELVLSDFLASMRYSNQIGRHGYTMSFTGILREFGIQISYIIFGDGSFVIDGAGNRYVFKLNPF